MLNTLKSRFLNQLLISFLILTCVHTYLMQIRWRVTHFIVIHCCFHCLCLLHLLLPSPAIWRCNVRMFYLPIYKLQQAGFNLILLLLPCLFLPCTSYPPHPFLISRFYFFLFPPPVGLWTGFVCMFVCFGVLLDAVGDLQAEQNLNFNPSLCSFESLLSVPPPHHRPSWLLSELGREWRTGGVVLVG